MGIPIHFELGPKYRIIYTDGTSKVFIVMGGPDPKVLLENGEKEGLESLSSTLLFFSSIEKLD